MISMFVSNRSFEFFRPTTTCPITVLVQINRPHSYRYKFPRTPLDVIKQKYTPAAK